VSTPGGGRAIVDSALDRFGRLDAVVSNAGIFHTLPFEELSASEWRRMIEVHLHGAFFVAQPAFTAMRQQGYGRFVFIASSAGLFGQPSSAHYAAAKAGLMGLTNVIAIEGAEHGILANSVLPFGYTRMVTETIGDATEEQRDGSPFLRAIEPDRVVPIVVYLASRACEVTHHNYSACAGRFARAFVGLGEGWLAPPGPTPTAEDVATHWDAISATDPYTVPTSIFDEVAGLCERLGITA
jgi:NAD(P)-dependent dehydrogenase (short-subunit alcohol dehydrogenase family)